MIGRWELAMAAPRRGSWTLAAGAFAAILGCGMVCGFPGRAVAQLNVQPPAQSAQAQPVQAQPAPAQPQPQAPAAAPAPKKEGFFDALGRWWDQSAADFDAGLKKMKSQIEEANERNAKAVREATQGAVTATKEATDALSKLPTRIVEGRERCALAPNGSPDCGPAAESICKAKGFKSGSSANIESARKCSARALLSRNEEDCVNETIVTRAACN